MLSDDNIEAVVSFLPDVKTMAAFASAGRAAKDMVYAGIPAAIQSAKPKMTKLQKESLGNLKNPGLVHLKAIVERKCLVCKKDFKGAIRAPWGIPAHKDCNKRLGTNVHHISKGIPESLMPLIRATIPVEVTEGTSLICDDSERWEYVSERIIVRPVPGVIPESMTLEHFNTIDTNDVSAWMENRKRKAEEWKTDGQSLDKWLKAKRRIEIEKIVKTTYRKWMRTVPDVAKNFLLTLEGWESVAVVGLVNANTDFSDEMHQTIFRLACTYSNKSFKELAQAYALVREHPQDAQYLRRYNVRLRHEKNKPL